MFSGLCQLHELSTTLERNQTFPTDGEATHLTLTHSLCPLNCCTGEVRKYRRLACRKRILDTLPYGFSGGSVSL